MRIPVIMLVAEPWNFVGPDGKNIILGSVDTSRTGTMKKEKQWVIVDCNPFEDESTIITSLLCTARHKGEGDLIQGIITSNRGVAVNAGWLLNGQQWTDQLVLEYELDWKISGGFLIVSIINNKFESLIRKSIAKEKQRREAWMQKRKEAEEAWQAKDYKRVISILENCDCLGTIEQKRLNYAKRLFGTSPNVRVLRLPP